jgi:hypothetical protein
MICRLEAGIWWQLVSLVIVTNDRTPINYRMVAGNSHSTIGDYATVSRLGQSVRNLPLLASVGPAKRASHLATFFSPPSTINFYIDIIQLR